MSENRVVITRSQRLGVVGLAAAVLVAAVLLLNFGTVGDVSDAAAGGVVSVGFLVVFGVSYALASLSYTLPVFLSVVVGSIAGTNFLSGFQRFDEPTTTPSDGDDERAPLVDQAASAAN